MELAQQNHYFQGTKELPVAGCICNDEQLIEVRFKKPITHTCTRSYIDLSGSPLHLGWFQWDHKRSNGALATWSACPMQRASDQTIPCFHSDPVLLIASNGSTAELVWATWIGHLPRPIAPDWSVVPTESECFPSYLYQKCRVQLTLPNALFRLVMFPAVGFDDQPTRPNDVSKLLKDASTIPN